MVIKRKDLRERQMDRCQNKGDSQSCPDLGAKERIEGESGKSEVGTVRMDLDYTGQCTMASFTKSRAIFIVFE